MLTALASLRIKDWRARCVRWVGVLTEAEARKLSVLETKALFNGKSAPPFDADPRASSLRRALYFDQASWLPDNVLERADRMTMAASLEARADSRIQEAASKLALAQQQLARTEVRADVSGIVVYRDVFFGSEQRKPQVGDQVWANQPLLILPDISKMVVETRVRETDIHKVEKNQNVGVRIQAYPDLRLTGKVTLV